MTYEQLRVLQAIVRAGTFRGAAEQIHKSQPALSAMIRNLEGELGFPLFDRQGYRPVLTARGRAFYERAVVALKEMAGLRALAQRLTGEEEAEVRLAVNNVFPLAEVLDTLREVDAA